MSRWRAALLDSLILICLTVLLIKPLFRLKYLDNWGSIESTFISDARMLSEHLPHPGWQPLWYCGTRTDYIYPPALRYGTVLIMKVGHVLPARAYHLYTAFFYVLGILAVYWLVRAESGSRGEAWLAAAATALLSPSFLLLKNLRVDSGYWVPWRLRVLTTYGEGPHISSLCILPLALAVAFMALRKWRPAALAAAGALCALIAATNFYGAVALAIFYALAVWSVWNGENDRRVLWRAAAIPLIAYGLSAFWLTPSYARITLVDLKWVTPPGNPVRQFVLVLAVALYCYLSRRLARGRPEREWRVFVVGAVVIFTVYVLGYYYIEPDTFAGGASRMVPELDLALILGAAEVLRRLWVRPRLRAAVAVLTVLAFLPVVRYMRHVWSPFPKAESIENSYAYRTTRWVHDHLSGERVLPTGVTRFWFDGWADNAQTDGGSDQGMLNQNLPAAFWQIQHGDRVDLAMLWLQALGTDAIIVPDRTSPDPYIDYPKPDKFRSLPILYDDGQGTVIYRIPRVHPGLGRVVDRDRMAKIGPVTGEGAETLMEYAAVVEDPAHPEAAVAWKGFGEADIHAKVRPGESVLLQETWDPAWRAYENGRELPVRVEPVMDFMLIDLPAGEHNIRMQFETPLENRIGQFLFAVTAIAVGFVVFARPRVFARPVA